MSAANNIPAFTCRRMSPSIAYKPPRRCLDEERLATAVHLELLEPRAALGDASKVTCACPSEPARPPGGDAHAAAVELGVQLAVDRALGAELAPEPVQLPGVTFRQRPFLLLRPALRASASQPGS